MSPELLGIASGTIVAVFSTAIALLRDRTNRVAAVKLEIARDIITHTTDWISWFDRANSIEVNSGGEDFILGTHDDALSKALTSLEKAELKISELEQFTTRKTTITIRSAWNNYRTALMSVDTSKIRPGTPDEKAKDARRALEKYYTTLTACIRFELSKHNLRLRLARHRLYREHYLNKSTEAKFRCTSKRPPQMTNSERELTP